LHIFDPSYISVRLLIVISLLVLDAYLIYVHVVHTALQWLFSGAVTSWSMVLVAIKAHYITTPPLKCFVVLMFPIATDVEYWSSYFVAAKHKT